MMMSFVWIGVALGADLRVAHTEALGTDILDVVVDADQSAVALLESGTGQVRVLSLSDWTVGAQTVCPGKGTALASAPSDSEFAGRIYVGCDDGTVGWLTAGRTGWRASDGRVELGSSAVLGLVAVAGNVWAVADQADDEGNPQIFGFAETASADAATPAEQGILGVGGFVDFEPATAVAFVSHGGDRMSRVDGNTGSITVPMNTIGVADTQDVIVTPGNAVLAAAGTGGVVSYSIGGSDLGLILDDEDGLRDVTALFWMDGLLWTADAGRQELLAFDMASTASVPGDDIMGVIEPPADQAQSELREVAVVNGYAVAGTNDGAVWVITDRPWVDVSGVTPATALQGDEAVVTFTSDSDGAWTLYRDATTNTDGVALASGRVTRGAETQATFRVGAGFAEGANDLRLVVEDDDGSRGHDSASLVVDNPPGAVRLGGNGVAFGDQKLFVRFRALSDEDVSDYSIFVTTTRFARGDWNACDSTVSPCGPEFDGTDNFVAPVAVVAAPDEEVEVTLEPLTNGQTYYVAVRATDAGGQEGSMSRVRSGTPQKTYGIAGLSGDTGGYCGVAGGASFSAVLVAMGMAIGRRRRWTHLGAGAVLFGGLQYSGETYAQDAVSDEPGLIDREARNGTVAVRYGPVSFADEDVVTVLGETENQILWVEFGPRLFPKKLQQLDLTFGLGRLREPGKLVNIQGTASGEESKLRAFPLAVDLTGRLQFIDEQWVVPYVSGGLEYWFWSEDTNVNGDRSDDGIIAGGKSGYHWSVGGNILLDGFDRDRASLLRARTGIDDTWLTVEYRDQTVGDGEGFDFNGTTIGVGLKVDY